MTEETNPVKVNGDDQPMKIGIGVNRNKCLVVVTFERPITWLAFTPDEADDVSSLLQEKSRITRGLDAANVKSPE